MAKHTPSPQELEALNTVHALAAEYGWKTIIWIPSDIRNAAKADLSDEDIDLIQSDYSWRKLDDLLIEDGWSFVRDAITSAGFELDEDY